MRMVLNFRRTNLDSNLCVTSQYRCIIKEFAVSWTALECSGSALELI